MYPVIVATSYLMTGAMFVASYIGLRAITSVSTSVAKAPGSGAIGVEGTYACQAYFNDYFGL